MTSPSALAALAFVLLAACSGAAATDESAPPVPAPADSEPVPPPPSSEAAPAPDGGAAKAACAAAPVVRESFASFADAGTTTYYRLTTKPRGIIVALHGAGGSSSMLVTESVEWASFFHEAVAHDYVILVPESLERAAPRQWNAQAANGDTPHIAALLDRLQTKGKLSPDLPLFVVGMSNGGGAAPIVGALLAKDGRPVRAIGIYCAGASSVFDRPDYTLPTVFSLVENDTVMTKRAEVEEAARALAARGVATDIAVLPSAPLCPEAFTRIPQIDAAASRVITSELRSAGVLAEDGRVVGFSRDLDIAALVPSYPSFGRQIEELLRVASAEHTFYGARNEATLAFFDARR